MTQWKQFVLMLVCCLFSCLVYASNGQRDDKETIKITPEGQQAAGIKTSILELRRLPLYVSAPGEIVSNTDQSAILTPRIRTQVLQRLVNVGETVLPGQPMVRLSSVAMANAQAALLLASKEWRRMKKLGQQAVSAKRYQSAQIAYQQTYAKLIAYGMTRQQIDTFLKSDNPNKADGKFTLLAPIAGTIFSAKFTEGQMIQPGETLFHIVNEAQLWVDARLSNSDASLVKVDAPALIKTPHRELEGRVLQVHHQLEATTRTQTVRIDLPNPKDLVHPGEFVTCLIQANETNPVLAVPKDALVQTPDGDYAVYVAMSSDSFKAAEVERVEVTGKWVVIKGLSPGERVVTEGAFFVHSEGLKRGFRSHGH